MQMFNNGIGGTKYDIKHRLQIMKKKYTQTNFVVSIFKIIGIMVLKQLHFMKNKEKRELDFVAFSYMYLCASKTCQVSKKNYTH